MELPSNHGLSRLLAIKIETWKMCVVVASALAGAHVEDSL